jgi:hypothetical protein
METRKTGCPKRPPRRSALQGLLGWYRAWVQMREARYRYLEAILDGTPDPGARSDDQRNAEKPDGAS